MTDIAPVEVGFLQAPEHKSFLPKVRDETGLSEETRNARKVSYVKESLENRLPYLGENSQEPASKSRITGVTIGSSIVYSNNTSNHGFLREGEGLSPERAPEDVQFEVELWTDGSMISIFGNGDSVRKTIDIFKKSGYAGAHAVSGGTPDNKEWKYFKGTLDNPNLT